MKDLNQEKLQKYEHAMESIIHKHFPKPIPGLSQKALSNCMLDWGKFIAEDIGDIAEEVLSPKKKVNMSLVGLDGNAFNLMGVFQANAKRQGWSKEEIDKVLDECQSSDYDHLVQTLMSNITN